MATEYTATIYVCEKCQYKAVLETDNAVPPTMQCSQCGKVMKKHK